MDLINGSIINSREITNSRKSSVPKWRILNCFFFYSFFKKRFLSCHCPPHSFQGCHRVSRRTPNFREGLHKHVKVMHFTPKPLGLKCFVQGYWRVYLRARRKSARVEITKLRITVLRLQGRTRKKWVCRQFLLGPSIRFFLCSFYLLGYKHGKCK